MRDMPDRFIDLVVTSPPYDDMRSYKGHAAIDVLKIAQELYRVVKVGGIVVWITGDQTKDSNESGTSFVQALTFKDVGFSLFDTMIYLKSPRGAVGNNKTYWQSFEYMFVFSKGKPKTINLLMDRQNKEERSGDNGTKRLKNGNLKHLKRSGYGKTGRRTNVWQYLVGKGHSSTDDLAREHPAIFPEELARDHILSWSNEKEMVFDPFMGSGTTAKMALLTNRNFIGSEIAKEYCRIADKRIKLAESIKKSKSYRKFYALPKTNTNIKVNAKQTQMDIL